MVVALPNGWLATWIAAALVLLGCGSGDDTGSGSKGASAAGGQSGDAGGVSGASAGGASQGGASGASAGGAADAGPSCGVESCTGAKKCCPTTGKCYDRSFETCSTTTCTVTSNASGGAAGAPNCCPMNLLHCAATGLCYYPGCVECCP